MVRPFRVVRASKRDLRAIDGISCASAKNMRELRHEQVSTAYEQRPEQTITCL